MTEIFGVPTQALFGQLLLGLINGSFYALLSLGLAVIFGMLNIINFTHGAQYMMGAFGAYLLGQWFGFGYWPSLILAPLIVGAFGVVIERTMLKRLYHLDHLYGLLFTFGVALIIQGYFRYQYGSSGLPYAIPPQLTGGVRLPFMFLPYYRGWVIVFSLTICLLTWFLIERTSLGAKLRAATENPTIVRTFGVNVPLLITLTYGAGVALAGLAGVLAAPIYQVSPLMGAELINVVFAVVVIGGMGSILGSVITGFALGLIEGLTKVFYPEASTTVVFVIMAIVLLVRPAGLFGKAATTTAGVESTSVGSGSDGSTLLNRVMIALFAVLAIAPFFVYPVFLMKALCIALLALSVNLLLGYAGLLSFGHAMFLGTAGYVAAHLAKIGAISLPIPFSGTWLTIPFPPFTPELAILFGTLSASLLGLVVGSIAIRRQGIYFAMTTLAFAQMVFFLAVQIPFTHGEDGIQAVPRGKLFGLFSLESQMAMYYVVFAIFAFALLALYRIIHSPFGEVLKSIRENEARAISLGYKTDRYKLVAFVLSTTICGLGGATKAIVFQLASLTDVSSGTSGEAVLMTLVGGLGTVLGPIIGATIITAMDTYLADTSWLINILQSFLPGWLTSALAGFLNVTVLEGIVFVVCVMAFRRGLLGEIAHRIGKPL